MLFHITYKAKVYGKITPNGTIALGWNVFRPAIFEGHYLYSKIHKPNLSNTSCLEGNTYLREYICTTVLSNGLRHT